MKLSMSELIQLKSVVIQELNRIKGQVQNGPFRKTVGEEVVDELPFEEFAELLDKMLQLEEDVIQLGTLITKLNLETMVQVNEASMSIREALEVAKASRNNAHIYNVLARKQMIVIDSGNRFSRETAESRTEYFHDVKQFQDRETRALRYADQLSRAVERASVLTEVDIDDRFEEYR